MSLDLSKLSAADAAVALRSYPRRYRTRLPLADDPDLEDLVERVGPDGHSVLDLVVGTANTWALLHQALTRTQLEDGPVLHAGATDPAQRSWEVPPGTTLAGALDRIDDEATALADAVDHVHGAQWSRPATVAGGAELTALDLVREAVRVGADDLDAIGRLLASLR